MDFLVSVHCLTYNHAAFIEDTMDGFCKQDTHFPFVCVIVDDASIDGEQTVIMKYIHEHFEIDDDYVAEEKDDCFFVFAHHKSNLNCCFAVYFLKENFFKRHESKDRFFDVYDEEAKYIALCEGDDYWVASNKLQRQVSFLEEYPDYLMTCCRTYLFSQSKSKMVGENYCYSNSRKISVRDTIYRTGLFISTCSIVYQKVITNYKPDYWRDCLVGDYPLQIACVLKGKAWYFNEAMSVYRINNSGSWMGCQNWAEGGADLNRRQIIESRVKMLKGFAKDFSQYEKLFSNKIADEINRNIPYRRVSREKVESYLDYFSNDIKQFNLRWRIDLLFRKCRVPAVRYIYQRIFNSRFLARNMYY